MQQSNKMETDVLLNHIFSAADALADFIMNTQTTTSLAYVKNDKSDLPRVFYIVIFNLAVDTIKRLGIDRHREHEYYFDYQAKEIDGSANPVSVVAIRAACFPLRLLLLTLARLA